MVVTDFEFDGRLLSELGYMIGYSNGAPESITNGSEITLDTVAFQNGMRYELATTTYNECLTTTFCIFKNPCVFDDDYIFCFEEIREIMRWLNRKKFCLFRFMDGDYINIDYQATFTNISKVLCNGEVIGLELTLQTDKPFGYGRKIKKVFESTTADWSFKVGYDTDDETGIYPQMKITIGNSLGADSTLRITNHFNGEETVIKDCSIGEVITMEYPMIFSNNGVNNDIPDRFNWNWFRIENAYRKRTNKVSVNIPCKIELSYAPIVKVGLL